MNFCVRGKAKGVRTETIKNCHVEKLDTRAVGAQTQRCSEMKLNTQGDDKTQDKAMRGDQGNTREKPWANNIPTQVAKTHNQTS